jgi:cysteine-rich repeat protein
VRIFLLLFSLLVYTVSSAQSCPAGSISHFKFEDSNLGLDSLATNTGITSGSVSQVSGINGQAVQFSGGNIDFADSVSLDLTTSFTVSFFMNETTSLEKKIMVGKFGQDAREWAIRKGLGADKQKLLVSFGQPGGDFLGDIQTASNVINQTGVWYHVAVTFSSGTVKIYIDGVEQATVVSRGTIPTSVWTDGSPLRFGQGGDGISHNFLGSLDEVLISDYAMNATEILDIYRSVTQYNQDSCFTPVVQCGDGILDGTEVCDDGNVVNGDGCSNTCQYESSLDGAQCDASIKAYFPFENIGYPGFDEIDETVLENKSATVVSSPLGNSASFTSSPRSAFEAESDSFLDISDNMTVSVWFNESTLSLKSQIVGKIGVNAFEWALRKARDVGDEKKLFITFGDSNGALAGDYITTDDVLEGAGIWYNATFSFASGTVKMYVNGLEVPLTLYRGFIPTTLNTSGAPLSIGNGAEGSNIQFEGMIDEVTVWDRVLTNNEVYENYQKAFDYDVNACQSFSPVCGNGIFDFTEECDDSNTSNGDGCTSSCEYELSINPASCKPTISNYFRFSNPIAPELDEISKVSSEIIGGAVDSESDNPKLKLNTDPAQLRTVDSPSLDKTNQFSALGLVRDTANVDRKIIFGKYEQDNREWALRTGVDSLNSKKIMVSFGDQNGDFAGDWMSSYDVFTNQNQTYQVGFTFDSGVVRLYVDGEEIPGFVSRGYIPTQIYKQDAVFRIGRSDSTLIHQFQGEIDDVALYDEVLSESDFREHYNNSIVLGGQNQCEQVTATCGNGVIEAAEICDDSNLIDGDGCSSACEIESHVLASDCRSDIKAYFTFNNVLRPELEEIGPYNPAVQPSRSNISGSGVKGLGASFLNNYIAHYEKPELDFTTTLSGMAWINEPSLQDTTVIFGKYGQDNREWALRKGFGPENNKKIMVSFGDQNGDFAGDWITSNDVILNSNTWYHVAFTYDQGVVKFYIDGSEVPGEIYRGYIPTTLNTSGSALRVGRSGEGLPHQFVGSVDDVALFSSVLTSDEISYFKDAAKFCEPNLPPQAGEPITLTSNEDETLILSVPQGNDIDSGSLTYDLKSISSGSISGCLDGTSSLSCQYTPGENYNGPVSITYEVSDGDATSLVDGEIILNILPINDLPVISVTSTPSVVTLGGSISATSSVSDVDGDSLTTTWDMGNGTVLNGSSISYSYPSYGTYNIIASVDDGNGGISSVNRSVIINSPPISSFSESGTFEIGDEIVFNSTGSDIDGGIVNYEWSFGDGNGKSSPFSQATHNYTKSGTYGVTLKVRDNYGATNISSKTIEVGIPNQVPIASFKASDNPGLINVPVTFTSKSIDTDGTLTRFIWSFGDGTVLDTTQSTISHSYSASGSYVVGLVVEDNKGASDSYSLSLEVSGANQAPIAGFNLSKSTVAPNQTVVFTSTSSDNDGTIAQYDWDFGDGTTSLDGSSIVSTSYSVTGTYDVMLTVTDSFGATAQITKQVVVEVPNVPPVASFTYTPEFPRVGDTVTFTDTSTDSDGTIVSRRWDFGDGTSLETSDVSVEKVFNGKGTFEIVLEISDNEGSSSSSLRSLFVEDNVEIPEGRILSFQEIIYTDLPARFLVAPEVSSSFTVDWRFGNGDVASGTDGEIYYAYSSPGQYTVEADILSGQDILATFSLDVSVDENGSGLNRKITNVDDRRDVHISHNGRHYPTTSGSIVQYTIPDQTGRIGVERGSSIELRVYWVSDDGYFSSIENVITATSSNTSVVQVEDAGIFSIYDLYGISPGEAEVTFDFADTAGLKLFSQTIKVIVENVPTSVNLLKGFDENYGQAFESVTLVNRTQTDMIIENNDGTVRIDFPKALLNFGWWAEVPTRRAIPLFSKSTDQNLVFKLKDKNTNSTLESLDLFVPAVDYGKNLGLLFESGLDSLDLNLSNSFTSSYNGNFHLNFDVFVGPDGEVPEVDLTIDGELFRISTKRGKNGIMLRKYGNEPRALVSRRMESSRWYNIGVNFEIGTKRSVSLYVNGNTSGRLERSAPPAILSPTVIRIDGAEKVKMDNIRLFDRILSESEISALVAGIEGAGLTDKYSFSKSNDRILLNEAGDTGRIVLGNSELADDQEPDYSFASSIVLDEYLASGRSEFDIDYPGSGEQLRIVVLNGNTQSKFLVGLLDKDEYQITSATDIVRVEFDPNNIESAFLEVPIIDEVTPGASYEVVSISEVLLESGGLKGKSIIPSGLDVEGGRVGFFVDSPGYYFLRENTEGIVADYSSPTRVESVVLERPKYVYDFDFIEAPFFSVTGDFGGFPNGYSMACPNLQEGADYSVNYFTESVLNYSMFFQMPDSKTYTCTHSYSKLISDENMGGQFGVDLRVERKDTIELRNR